MFENIPSLIETIETLSADFYVGTSECRASDVVVKILETVDDYVKKHGSIALSCGGEFVYQDDDAQVDAINYFVDILETLAHCVKCEDEVE